MNIPTIEFDENGDIVTLWSDQIDLYDLGHVCNVRTASTVEFSEQNQEWEVRLAESDEVIHSNKSREEAIDWEIVNVGPGGQYYRR